uniref:hypothetical protein n=1 Tax=Pelagibius marinus TaxID=2762760 RepID=UPI001D04F265
RNLSGHDRPLTREKSHNRHKPRKVGYTGRSRMNKQKALTERRHKQWDASRRLRNSFSHAESQGLFDQTMALSNIAIATELINELFEDG